MTTTQLRDSRGLALTAASRSLVEHYEEAAMLFHGYYADPLAAIDRALADDPDFIMGLALKGGILATSTEKAAQAPLGEIVQRLESLAPSANARERGHIAALRTWYDGRFDAATERWGAVALDHPHDLLALQFAHLGDFYLGRSLMLRDRPARALHDWSRDIPGYGFVLGMWAFGLEEAGHYDAAERAGRDALALNARDPWSVHAVTHVMEMQNRLDDGIGWLESRSGDWASDNLFAFHNWWHLALYYLDRGDVQRVLSLYDTRIRPQPSSVALEMIDASALLWRLLLRDVDVGERWRELADSWTATIDDGHYAFNDYHAMMALVGAHRDADANRLIATLERAAQQRTVNGRMTRDVGLPVAQALRHHGAGRHEQALRLLLDVLPVAQTAGGSHAQRDVLHLTAVEAALRSGNRSVARGLVSQRLAAKPASPHNLQLASRCDLRSASRSST